MALHRYIYVTRQWLKPPLWTSIKMASRLAQGRDLRSVSTFCIFQNGILQTLKLETERRDSDRMLKLQRDPLRTALQVIEWRKSPAHGLRCETWQSPKMFESISNLIRVPTGFFSAVKEKLLPKLLCVSVQGWAHLNVKSNHYSQLQHFFFQIHILIFQFFFLKWLIH